MTVISGDISDRLLAGLFIAVWTIPTVVFLKCVNEDSATEHQDSSLEKR